MEIKIIDVLLQIANFSLLFFVLTKFLYKPIVQMLNQRSKTIEEGQKAAESNLRTQKQLTSDVEEELTKARKEATKIKASVKKEAEIEAQNILAKAKEDAKKVLEKERTSLLASIEAERKQIQSDLKDLVISSTTALLETGLSKDQQKQIIDQQIKNLKTVNLG